MGGSGYGGKGGEIPDPVLVQGVRGLQPPPEYRSHYDRRVEKLEAEVAALRESLTRRDDFSQWIDKATAYQTAVMAIAYAGFFVLWEKVGGGQVAFLHSLAGLFIGLSVFVYVFWTLVQMHGVHMEVVGKEPWLPKKRLDRAGPYIFAFSALTGIGAGSLILGMWLYRIFI